MTLSLFRQTNVAVDRRGGVRRRDFLRAIPLAGLAAGGLTWPDLMTVEAAHLRQQGKACILLWMQGGPSQFETFSPKPNHPNGGETKAISTAVSGIEIAENLPEVARVMNDLCVIRSVQSKEGNHPRAQYLLHTGYLPSASVKYPTLGAHVAHQLGDPQSELPGFVRIGRVRGGGGGGLLGVRYDPFAISNPERMPENTELASDRDRYRRRLQLLDRLETGYEAAGGQQEVADHRQLYDQASRLVLSPKMQAFDVEREPANVRQAYGDSSFAHGCLLARRLVEEGITFVEVIADNWDTHFDNFAQTRERCQEIDRPYAQLLRDLRERGMLEHTLVIWMGEFGRTPRINPRGGRDHFPRAFNMALAGAGVRGGQVIGRTDDEGASVADQPVGVNDLFRTICQALQINADHENMSSIGRPIKIVDGGRVVPEVFG